MSVLAAVVVVAYNYKLWKSLDTSDTSSTSLTQLVQPTELTYNVVHGLVSDTSRTR